MARTEWNRVALGWEEHCFLPELPGSILFFLLPQERQLLLLELSRWQGWNQEQVRIVKFLLSVFTSQ